MLSPILNKFLSNVNTCTNINKYLTNIVKENVKGIIMQCTSAVYFR